MAQLTAKDFINKFLIEETEKLVKSSPYFSFTIMGIGIEFLGKCIDPKFKGWSEGQSRKTFENAINTIPSLQKYSTYLDIKTYNLYDSFRCGLAHSAAPKFAITLSSKEESPHLHKNAGRINFKAEDFFKDFKDACNHVLSLPYDAGDKINQLFLEIPEPSSKSVSPGDASASGSLVSITSK